MKALKVAMMAKTITWMLTQTSPIADENWLQEYYRRREEEAEKVKELQLRWNESKPVTLW